MKEVQYMKQTHSPRIRTLWFILVITAMLIPFNPQPPAAHAATNCADEATTGIPQAECEALLALYNSTDGPNWRNNSGWNTATSACDWHGVSCTGENVMRLDLFSNSLDGEVPPNLGNLTNLQTLNLSNNELSGSIPPDLGNLMNLQTLYIHRNQMSGDIPPELGNLSNLRYLSLSNNELSESIPPELGNLTNLETLALSRNQLSGSIPQELWELTNLEWLNLADNQLSGSIPPELGNFTNLQTLILDNLQVNGSIPPELGNLTNLTYLDLSESGLTGNIPPELGNLTSLQTLRLSRNELSGSIAPELGNLTSLQTLELLQNQLSGSIPPELGNLTNLQTLDLSSNLLSGEIPPELGNLTNLRKLVLDDTQLSGEIPPELGNLTNLQSLSLLMNQLSGEIPPALGNLTNLQSLDLSDSGLRGRIPPELGNLTNLTNLGLSHNELRGIIPPNLGNLTNLQTLNLSNNELSGSIPPDLGNLMNLQRLYIHRNQMSGDIPPELGNLSNLRYLSLSNNELSGEIPPELGNLTDLQLLYLNNNALSGLPPMGLMNLIRIGTNKLDLGYNMLTTSGLNPALDVFLTGKDPDWKATQFSGPGVEINKTVSERVVSPGDTLTYMIVLTATDIAVPITTTDTLTDGLTYMPDSVSGGATYDGTTRQILYTGIITPNNPLTITYQASVDPTLAPGSVLYNATLLTTAVYTIERGVAVSIEDPSVLNTLVLIYANGDNNLADNMLDVANRTVRAAATPHATTLLLLDGPGDGDSYLYRLEGSEQWCSFYAGMADPTCGGRYEQGQTMWRWGEDLGSPYSLAEFVTAAFNAYPNADYDQVVLSLVGHGGGWSPELLDGQPRGHKRKPGDDPLGGLLWDNHPGNSLSTSDLGLALQRSQEATGHRIGLLFLDACLMSMVEVAYEVRENVDYLLASENWTWTIHSYDAHIGAVDGRRNARTIGKAWMENDANALREDDYPFTYALSDLSQIEAVRLALDTLSDALMPMVSSDRDKFVAAFEASECFETDGNGTIDQTDNYCDLFSFAEQISIQFDDPDIRAAAAAVQSALGDVVLNESHGDGSPWEYPNEHWAWENLGGLSLYMPLKEDDWKRRYYSERYLQFARDSRWDDLLQAYWNAEEIPADPNCPAEGCDLPEGPFSIAPISADARSQEESNHIEWQMVEVEEVVLATQAISTYHIYRRVADGTFSPEPIATTSSDMFEYVDGNLPDTESNAWCYQVKATDADDTIVGESNVACTSTAQGQQVYLPLVRR
jgi:uncharacterized repeat protein (TIGR01451 family)